MASAGLQLWSVRDALAADVPGTLARVRALGFAEVETAGTCGLSAGAFRQALEAAGLAATSMHVPYERLLTAPEGVWEEAATLGARHVGIPNLPAPGGRLAPARVGREADRLNAWGRAAHAHGVRFFLHTHGPELRADPDGRRPLDRIAEGTDPARVSFQLDVRWALLSGLRPADVLGWYPGRWRLLHLRDVGGAGEEATLGTGRAEVTDVLAAAEGAGVEACFVEDEGADPWARLRQGRAFLASAHFLSPAPLQGRG